MPYELDQQLRRALERSSRQLQRLGELARSLSRSGGLPSAIFDSLDEMMRALEEMNDTLERETIVPLEVLAAIEPFLEQAAIIEIAHRRQKRLLVGAARSELVGKVANQAWRRPSVESREIQEDIKKQFSGAVDKLEDLLGGLDAKALDLEDFAQDVRDFIDEARKSGVPEAMAEAERELERLTPEPGAKAARKALDLFDELLKRKSPKDLDRNLGGGGPGRPRFAPGIADALRQTAGRMVGERGLGQGGMNQDNVGLYGSNDEPRLETPSRTGALGNKTTAVKSLSGQRDDGHRNPAPQVGDVPADASPFVRRGRRPARISPPRRGLFRAHRGGDEPPNADGRLRNRGRLRPFPRKPGRKTLRNRHLTGDGHASTGSLRRSPFSGAAFARFPHCRERGRFPASRPIGAIGSRHEILGPTERAEAAAGGRFSAAARPQPSVPWLPVPRPSSPGVSRSARTSPTTPPSRAGPPPSSRSTCAPGSAVT